MNIAEEGKWRKALEAFIANQKRFISIITILAILLILGLFLLEKELLKRPAVRIYQDKSI